MALLSGGGFPLWIPPGFVLEMVNQNGTSGMTVTAVWDEVVR